MKLFNKTLASLCFFSLFIAPLSFSETVVIVHPTNDSPISKATIRKIYLGKTQSFDDGSKAIPIELAKGPARDEFLKIYLRKGDAQLHSYWTRVLFTGKATPPKSFDTELEIKNLVAHNPNIIGFIDSSLVDSSVRVVTAY